MMPPMRFFYYLGGFLLVLAFGSAAAEAIPRSISSGGWFVSAYELWYAFLPGNLVVTQIQVEKNFTGALGPASGQPVVFTGVVFYSAPRAGRWRGIAGPTKK